jgi:hypothetical protein
VLTQGLHDKVNRRVVGVGVGRVLNFPIKGLGGCSIFPSKGLGGCSIFPLREGAQFSHDWEGAQFSQW